MSEAYFDNALSSWIFRSYADVSAALRESRLLLPGASSSNALIASQNTHGEVRASISQWHSPNHLEALRSELLERAQIIVDALPVNKTLDLMHDFAKPWSLNVASLVANIPLEHAEVCNTHAQLIFDAASQSTDGTLSNAANNAAATLAVLLTRTDVSQHSQFAAADVQTFVALTHTLPSLLVNAFMLLLDNRDALEVLRRDSSRISHATGEMLRLAGPSRAVFRIASAKVAVNSTHLNTGDRAVLMLGQANRDPARFDDPAAFKLDRPQQSHLAFGLGAHSCAGAGLVRLLLTVACEVFAERLAQLEPVYPPELNTSFAIASPIATLVRPRPPAIEQPT